MEKLISLFLLNITVMTKKRKVWCSATIDKENYDAVRQKALELYGGKFSPALNHIISVYRSVWTDLMMARLRTEVYDAFTKMKEQKEKEGG